MRIAAGGIAIECCTFSPLLTTLDDFNVLRAQELWERYPFVPTTDDLIFEPIFHASAVPSGPVQTAAYEHLKREFMTSLEAGRPWDGVYLDMHGAMAVEGMDDAEGDWIAAVRQIVGPDCLISASYDLHGNVSQRVIDQVDALTAYRTAPHMDRVETRERAFRLLLVGLQDDVRLHKAFISIPLILSGERTMTTAEPGASVYARIPDVIDGAQVLDASILVGYTWADEARVQASAVAIGTEETATWNAAIRLAQTYWDARHDFQFGMPTGSVDDCIQMALDAPEACVFLSDSGDNVTGGGIGDVTVVLGRLLAHRVPSAVYASIADAEAVESCFEAGMNAMIDVSLGGKLDTLNGAPLDVRGQVIALEKPEAHHRQAVLLVDHVKVILTERRMAFTTVAQFTQLGIEPLAHKIVCVKLGYLFPDLQRIAPKAVMAFSPGVIPALTETIPFQRIQRPMYPLDPDMQWTPVQGE